MHMVVADPRPIWTILGEVPKRQRKVMLPAFGSPESKALLPVFRHYAEQVRGSRPETGTYRALRLTGQG